MHMDIQADFCASRRRQKGHNATLERTRALLLQQEPLSVDCVCGKIPKQFRTLMWVYIFRHLRTHKRKDIWTRLRMHFYLQGCLSWHVCLPPQTAPRPIGPDGSCRKPRKRVTPWMITLSAATLGSVDCIEGTALLIGVRIKCCSNHLQFSQIWRFCLCDLNWDQGAYLLVHLVESANLFVWKMLTTHPTCLTWFSSHITCHVACIFICFLPNQIPELH